MRLDGLSVLVTGGAGFIGSHLVDALLRGGVRSLRVLDDLSTGSEGNLAQHASDARLELVRGDVRDATAVRVAMAGIEVVFHLACRGVRHSIGHPRENHEVNAGGTLAVLGAARAAAVRRVVHVSSSEVYGTALHAPMTEAHPCLPETVYGAAKLAGEAYARAYFRTYGLSTMVVRPFNNFGPRSHHEGDAGEVIPRFAVGALNGKRPVVFGDGEQTRDFIYVEDTAYWLCRLAEHDAAAGETVNLGSGIETSVNTLAAEVCAAAGRPDLVAEHGPARPGDVRRHVAGADRARSMVGFAPRVSVRDGIARLVDHLRALPGGPPTAAEQPARNWVEGAEGDAERR